MRYEGGDIAGTQGQATIQLEPVDPALSAAILPGDIIVVKPDTGEVVTVTAPALMVEVDATTDRIVGRAPPGATVGVELADGTDLGILRADATGSFQVDLAGQRDLVAGDYGQVHYVTPAGYDYHARFAVFDATVPIRGAEMPLHASPGAVVVVEVTGTGGASHSASTTVAPTSLSSSNRDITLGGLPALSPGTSATITRVSPVPGMDLVLRGDVPDL